MLPHAKVGAWPAWRMLGFGLGVALLFRVAILGQPPHGEHAWRDADGIGVARCFLREGFNLLQPRVMERGQTSGIVGMELPVVNAAAAGSMGLFGMSDLAARVPVWLCLVPLGCACLALARRMLRDEVAAQVSAAVLVLQPLVIVFSRKLMPEIPMLALLLAALILAHDALANRSTWRALAAGLLFALAALLKPTGAAAGVLVVCWVIRAAARSDRSMRWVAILRGMLMAALPCLATALWFTHANALTQTYGVPLFRLHQDWLEWVHLLPDPGFWLVVLGRVAHLYLLWPTVIWMAWSWRITLEVLRAHGDLALWAAASLLLVIAFGSHSLQHEYYALPLLPPLALIAGDFVARASRLHSRPRLAQAAFLGVFALVSLIRAAPRMPPLDFDAARVAAAMRRIPHVGLAVATDKSSPVISLVILDREGWSLPAESLTATRISAMQALGAHQLVESSFGGWLSPEARHALPPPLYADDQLRVYSLPGELLR